MNRFLLSPIVFALTVGTTSVVYPNVVVSVPDVAFTMQDLSVTSLGATTSNIVLTGNYVVGPRGVAGQWERPIIPFPRSSFASIAGLPLVSAKLNYTILGDFAETGESFSSEVRLFSTNQTNLTSSNRNVFAGLTGDGGTHAVVGSALLVDGVTGPQSLAFSPAALTALSNAINGTDATIGIAFREFAGDDILDEFVFGVPPGVMSIEVTAAPAIPEPSSLVIWSLGLLGLGGCGWRKRCGR